MNEEIDIIQIDSRIKSHFSEKNEKLYYYRQHLAELEKTFLTNIPIRIKNDVKKSIDTTREIIEKLQNNEDLNFYISETMELIQKYNEILKTPLKISFMGKQRQENNLKNEIVNTFINIAQKYYCINRKCTEKKFKIECENCQNKKDFIVEENAYICDMCGCQQEIIHNLTSYRDSDRVNISTKYTYDRKVHFRDCINQYQGKQNCTIEQKIYENLEDIFEKHHLISINKEEKKEIRFKNVTKEHILMFLKELGYSKHYENVTLIYCNLTGKRPDDISYIEDKLLNDFDILVETYDKHFKNKVDRVNFISTQYVLFQLLQKYKHQCRKEDFVMLKTMDRKSFHDTICGELFSILGWNFTPLY